MATLSPALATHLDYALARYGLTTVDVPRDHEGKAIVQRVQMLDEDVAGDGDAPSVDLSIWSDTDAPGPSRLTLGGPCRRYSDAVTPM